MTSRGDPETIAPGTAPAVPRRRLPGLAVAAAMGLLCVTVPSIAPPRPRLVWNGSASAPRGLYLVTSAAALRRGDLIIARLPLATRAFAARRRFLPPGVPVLKHVAALRGDRICARDTTIIINGRRVARRRARDGVGRPMPWWRGCTVLADEVLLLNRAAASFDGRYFGPTATTDILGRARPLWLE